MCYKIVEAFLKKVLTNLKNYVLWSRLRETNTQSRPKVGLF